MQVGRRDAIGSRGQGVARCGMRTAGGPQDLGFERRLSHSGLFGAADLRGRGASRRGRTLRGRLFSAVGLRRRGAGGRGRKLVGADGPLWRRAAGRILRGRLFSATGLRRRGASGRGCRARLYSAGDSSRPSPHGRAASMSVPGDELRLRISAAVLSRAPLRHGTDGGTCGTGGDCVLVPQIATGIDFKLRIQMNFGFIWGVHSVPEFPRGWRQRRQSISPPALSGVEGV